MRKPIKYLLLCVWLLAVTSVEAQEAQEPKKWYEGIGKWVASDGWEFEGVQPVSHTKYLFQYGGRGVLDEYLSPISHSGYHLQLSFLTDYGAPVDRSWHLYQELLVSGGEMKNKANGSKMQNIGISYSIGPSWRVWCYKGFSIDMAPLITLYLGGNFKLSNTNNVANAKGGLGIDGWTRLRYQIPWRVMPLAISYSIQTPLVYGTFHPQYGQSYYDYISGENMRALDFAFTSLHNSLGIRQRLLVDLPIHNLTLTLGAEHSHIRQRIRSTKYREGTWSVLLGISIDSFSLSGNKAQKSNHISSTLYK